MQFRNLLYLFATATQIVCAQTSNVGVNLPYTNPMNGQDRVRSADGVECNRLVGPRQKWMEVGSFATQGTGQGADTIFSGVNGLAITTPDYRRTTVGVYAKVIINLDKYQPEIDCGQLYELEIARLRKELEESQLKNKASAYTGP
jgi:hypothetical protein